MHHRPAQPHGYETAFCKVCLLTHRYGYGPAASAYTEMNAISKGVSIGLYDEAKKSGVEASKGGSQPYVDLMGRRYVLLPPLVHSGNPLTMCTTFQFHIHLPKQSVRLNFSSNSLPRSINDVAYQRAETLSTDRCTKLPSPAGLRSPLDRPSRLPQLPHTSSVHYGRLHRTLSARSASSH